MKKLFILQLLALLVLSSCTKTNDSRLQLKLEAADGSVIFWKQTELTVDSFPEGVLTGADTLIQHGGFYFLGGEIGGEPLDHLWSYREKPFDGSTERGWLRHSALPVPMSNPLALPMGQAHVLLFTESHCYTYHCITDRWVEVEVPNDFDSPTAVAIANGMPLMKTKAGEVLKIELKRNQRHLAGTDYLVILFYMLLLLWIGWRAGKGGGGSEGYFLGSRKIPWWAVGISLYATGTSAISFLAIPTKTFVTNQVYGLGTLWGPIFMVVAAYTIVPILRGIKIYSTYEYLEARFGRVVRIFGAFVSVAFQLGGRMSIVLLLPALALSAVTGINVFAAVALMGVLATIYTVMGGIKAVIWTDVLQVVVLFGGAILAFVLMIQGSEGGLNGYLEIGSNYNKFKAVEWGFDLTLPVIWVFALNQMMTQASMPADQVMVQRVLTTPSVKQARKSYLFLGLIVVPGTILFHLLGSSMFTYFHSNPEILNPQMQNIQAFPLYIVEVLPAGICGLLIAALFAACMSTLDSSMNSVTTVIMRDFYPLFSRDSDNLSEAKFITAVVGLIGTAFALLMAGVEIKSMFDLWMEILALVGGGFGGVFMLGMFSKRANQWGAIIGALSSIFITLLVKSQSDVHFMLYSTVAVASCVIIGYISSLLIGSGERDLSGLTVFTK